MVSNEERVPNLGEAVTRYLAKISAKDREFCQPEVYKFARWCGWEISFTRLAGPAVAGYAEQLSPTDTDYTRKITLLRGFFAYARKCGWSETNLATHIKTKKVKQAGPVVVSPRTAQEPVTLSREKYDELTAELATLKKKSRDLIGDIQRAAADKDFRENAPLRAAREERGHVEGRLKELQETLKTAIVIDEKRERTLKSGVGDTIVMEDMETGEELRYMLVDTREVDPSRGKISVGSPIGKALIGKRDGEIAEITAPAGKMRYRILRIER
jgi:transcription elongation factor GreA